MGAPTQRSTLQGTHGGPHRSVLRCLHCLGLFSQSWVAHENVTKTPVRVLSASSQTCNRHQQHIHVDTAESTSTRVHHHSSSLPWQRSAPVQRTMRISNQTPHHPNTGAACGWCRSSPAPPTCCATSPTPPGWWAAPTSATTPPRCTASPCSPPHVCALKAAAKCTSRSTTASARARGSTRTTRQDTICQCHHAPRLDAALLQSLQPDVVLTQSLCEVCSVDLAVVERTCSQLNPQPTVLSFNPFSLEHVLQVG